MVSLFNILCSKFFYHAFDFIVYDRLRKLFCETPVTMTSVTLRSMLKKNCVGLTPSRIILKDNHYTLCNDMLFKEFIKLNWGRYRLYNQPGGMDCDNYADFFKGFANLFLPGYLIGTCWGYGISKSGIVSKQFHAILFYVNDLKDVVYYEPQNNKQILFNPSYFFV